jgi:glycosyltransferase involved in cell wall biosynthesis
MKKVLVITYYWPPSGGAGVQRWLKFVKYLRNSGWEPVVYTPENPEFPETDSSLSKDIPPGIEIVRRRIWEPYDAYKRLLGRSKKEKINAAFLTEKKKVGTLESLSVWIRGNLFIPDARKFWIKPSMDYLSAYLKDHPADAIISTGPPHSMHLIALGLAAKTGIPWLADFRDPWTNIDFYKDLKLTSAADAKHRRLEKEVLSKATAVTVISKGMAEDFNRILPRKYEVITNGYDPGDTDLSHPQSRDKKFSIAHIGTLVGTRNPETLWLALKELVIENASLRADLEIKLVGKVDFRVNEAIASHGLESFVKRIPYMPHNEVISCQQQSAVLLLIINDTPNARMILTGKFFEYLAARRPILCLGPADGDAAEILKETEAGMLAGFGDVETMKRNVLDLYASWTGGREFTGGINIERFSRPELTVQLAKLLNSITGG